MSNEIIILGNFGNSDNSALQKDFQSQEILNVAKKKYKNLKIGIVNNQENFQLVSEDIVNTLVNIQNQQNAEVATWFLA